MSLKDKACIVGIGTTEYSRNAGRSEIHLGVDAVVAACEDSGLDVEKIDGMSSFGTAGVFAAEMASDIDIAQEGVLKPISPSRAGRRWG